MSDKRKNGYYWVSDKEGIHWSIAEWVGDCWFQCGNQKPYRERYYFATVKEETIKPPKWTYAGFITDVSRSPLTFTFMISSRLVMTYDHLIDHLVKGKYLTITIDETDE